LVIRPGVGAKFDEQATDFHEKPINIGDGVKASDAIFDLIM